jgi:hypothetical protein
MTRSLFRRTKLTVCEVTLEEANAYVAQHHRHSLPTVGHKWSIAAVADEHIVGVAIIGRPVNRVLDDGWTMEALRVCTTGHPNACSFLYGASWRIVKAHGYLHVVTYVKDDETAASVRAAGWLVEGTTKGREWDTPARPRERGKREVSNRRRYGACTEDYVFGMAPRPLIEVRKVSRDQMELAA